MALYFLFGLCICFSLTICSYGTSYSCMVIHDLGYSCGRYCVGTWTDLASFCG